MNRYGKNCGTDVPNLQQKNNEKFLAREKQIFCSLRAERTKFIAQKFYFVVDLNFQWVDVA